MGYRPLTEQERADHLEWRAARRSHPVWDKMLFDHECETMRGILRRYEFSWLPMTTLLQWARALPDA